MAWNYLLEMEIPTSHVLDWIPIGVMMLCLKGILFCFMGLTYVGFAWTFDTLVHLEESIVQLALKQHGSDIIQKALRQGGENTIEKKGVE